MSEWSDDDATAEVEARIARVVRKTETLAGPGTSFTSLFHLHLALGTLSRRRVWQLVNEATTKLPEGFVPRVAALLGRDSRAGKFARQVCQGTEFGKQLMLASL